MGYSQQSALLWAMALLAWAMVILPSVLYLYRVWEVRRDRLISVLGPEALHLYFQQFSPADVEKAAANPVEYFRSYFGLRYGRRQWLLPLLTFGVTSALVIWFVLGEVLSWLRPGVSLVSLEVVISALLGAYAWCLVDQWRRIRDQDLSPHDLYGGAIRYLVSVPLALAIASALKPDVAMGVAFLLGAFPTRDVFAIARRIAGQRLGVTMEDENSPSDLTKLQGVGAHNADRFRQEGVTTVAELAWCDPVDLTIRTNMQLNFVIDTISQALLWIYFESDTPKLYRFSLRGAQEVANLVDAYDSDPPATEGRADPALAEAHSTVAAIVTTLGGPMDERSLMTTLREVAEDPYTQFLCHVWA